MLPQAWNQEWHQRSTALWYGEIDRDGILDHFAMELIVVDGATWMSSVCTPWLVSGLVHCTCNIKCGEDEFVCTSLHFQLGCLCMDSWPQGTCWLDLLPGFTNELYNS